MGRTAEQLSQELSYSELLEHIADWSIEPWDQVRGDLQTAQIVSTLANLHRARGQKPFTLDDCLLSFEAKPEEEQPINPQAVVNQLERFFARYEQHQQQQ